MGGELKTYITKLERRGENVFTPIVILITADPNIGGERELK